MSSLCSYAPFEPATPKQQGGGSSDFVGSFYARGISLPELNRVTLENIDKSPMFNPLVKDTVIPTVLTGIIPVAAVLAQKEK